MWSIHLVLLTSACCQQPLHWCPHMSGLSCCSGPLVGSPLLGARSSWSALAGPAQVTALVANCACSASLPPCLPRPPGLLWELQRQWGRASRPPRAPHPPLAPNLRPRRAVGGSSYSKRCLQFCTVVFPIVHSSCGLGNTAGAVPSALCPSAPGLAEFGKAWTVPGTKVRPFSSCLWSSGLSVFMSLYECI